MSCPSCAARVQRTARAADIPFMRTTILTLAASTLLLTACGSDGQPAAASKDADLQGRIAAACGYERDELSMGRKVEGGVGAGAEAPLATNQATSNFLQAAAVQLASGAGAMPGYLQEWVAGDGGSVLFLSQDQTAHCSSDRSTHSVAP